MAIKKKSMASSMNDELATRVLDQIPTPVFAVDMDMKLIFINQQGRTLLGKESKDALGHPCYSLFHSQHCETAECRMKTAMASGEPCTARNEAKIGDRVVPIEYTAAPLTDKNGKVVGGLEYILDITERVRDEKRLREQSRTIQEISTPAISLWEGIVVLPVLGVVDSLRAKQMMNAMLTKIKETAAKTIILDIQGVAAVDTAVANHLIKITKATKLMGCRCIISGISPAVAETLVQLGIDLGDVATNSSLRDALGDAFTFMNLEVKKAK
ncbi:rsbT co-antagonist protein RsbR [Desulfobaculum xiamenense]|uniref:RsbT co-antagonist protein RsbR n=1 Tax=Desulfobaculum xiamenense TaxID=995050 RepID=A0A846QQH6_9BACT|nr:PAS domain-containing protein [Desulfobaculum xiamenense]NJB69427.1 rsbT co-antagonist protein RsbR [Desulfobaculum xiamenense]